MNKQPSSMHSKLNRVTNILRITTNLQRIAIVVLLSLLLFTPRTNGKLGTKAVNLMYNFKAPEDLIEQYEELSTFIDKEAMKDISIDDPLRVVNAYYKFQAKPSQVTIEWYSKNVVVYQLHNDNIDESRRWMLVYDTDKQGKICNIREYALTSVYAGESGMIW